MARHPNPAIAIANDEVKHWTNCDVCHDPAITSEDDVYRAALPLLGVDVSTLAPGEARDAFYHWRMQRRDHEAAHPPLNGREPYARGWAA
jgi:hypothetical protein